jgi:hypothetical protein
MIIFILSHSRLPSPSFAALPEENLRLGTVEEGNEAEVH